MCSGAQYPSNPSPEYPNPSPTYVGRAVTTASATLKGRGYNRACAIPLSLSMPMLGAASPQAASVETISFLLLLPHGESGFQVPARTKELPIATKSEVDASTVPMATKSEVDAATIHNAP